MLTMGSNSVKVRLLSSPCPIVKGSVVTFRHTNGFTAVDVIKTPAVGDDPFVTGVRYGTLHKDNLIPKLVVVTGNGNISVGSQLVIDEMIYNCDKIVGDLTYHVSRPGHNRIVPQCMAELVLHRPRIPDDISVEDLIYIYHDMASVTMSGTEFVVVRR